MKSAEAAGRWPERLWIVRHGQSAGNVANDAAAAGGAHRLELPIRDADVPLSGLGELQARALGDWFAALPEGKRPEVVLSSPYVRARQTTECIGAAGGFSPTAIRSTADERLREKEFGILDRLTWDGVEALHPDQAEFRRFLGKFYHRPPGGESWCDVILRLRSLLDSVGLHHGGRRVLIVSHQVVVLCLRYLLEELDEAAILAVDAAGEVANCSVTEYALDSASGLDGALNLERFNFVTPLREVGAPVTGAPDVKGVGS
jgi:broad specificity phosphatase PhoE